MKQDNFLPIADLMSVLMMVFLFIAVAFMLDVHQQLDQQKQTNRAMADIAKSVNEQKITLLSRLKQAFKQQELNRWNAEIELVEQQPTLVFTPLPTVIPPVVLFDSTGRYQSTLKPQFKEQVLNCFFPRFIALLYPFRDEIASINIYGHTSIGWKTAIDENQAYLNNMSLSQKRAYNTLTAAFDSIRKPLSCNGEKIIPLKSEIQNWLKTVLRANGLADIKQKQFHLSNDMARRVEFQVVNRVEEKFSDIIQRYQQQGLNP